MGCGGWVFVGGEEGMLDDSMSGWPGVVLDIRTQPEGLGSGSGVVVEIWSVNGDRGQSCA